MKQFAQISSLPQQLPKRDDGARSSEGVSKKSMTHLPPRSDSCKYNRQQSIIDGLTENKMKGGSFASSNGVGLVESQYAVMTQSPSIEHLLHQQDIKSSNPLVRKIQDIFVNKATLSSKQINSSILLNNINEPLFVPKKPTEIISYLNKSPNKNTSRNILHEPFLYSPDKSNSKPFLRKKSSEKMPQNQELAAMHKQSMARQNESKFDMKAVSTSIGNMKLQTRRLQLVVLNIEQISRSGRLDNEMDFNLNMETDVQLLKFMVQKAIIRKDQHLP